MKGKTSEKKAMKDITWEYQSNQLASEFSSLLWAKRSSLSIVSLMKIFLRETKSTSKRLMKSSRLERKAEDFYYLIGLQHKDDEDGLLYETTRISVRKGMIVAYRRMVSESVASSEEKQPIHVQDIANLTASWILKNPVIDGTAQSVPISQNLERVRASCHDEKVGGGGTSKEQHHHETLSCRWRKRVDLKGCQRLSGKVEDQAENNMDPKKHA
jgi:hypothetical protein